MARLLTDDEILYLANNVHKIKLSTLTKTHNILARDENSKVTPLRDCEVIFLQNIRQELQRRK